MYGYPDAVQPDAVQPDAVQTRCNSVKTGLMNAKLGDFVNLGRLWLCGSIVAYPKISRLVPSRFWSGNEISARWSQGVRTKPITIEIFKLPARNRTTSLDGGWQWNFTKTINQTMVANSFKVPTKWKIIAGYLKGFSKYRRMALSFF